MEEKNNIRINKGTVTGGATTNVNGKRFEDNTNNYLRLLENGYMKNSFIKNRKYLTTKQLYLYRNID
jgi:hypothetical protein